MNDVYIASDGYILAGLTYSLQEERCFGQGCGVIKGSLVKLSATGDVEWQKFYGNYRGGVGMFEGLEEGDNALIYNECWSVAPRFDADGTTHNGYVLACGTGIEGCPVFRHNFKPSLLSECRSDPRTTWRSLTVATDLDGEPVYVRQDSFLATDDSEMPSQTSAAAEWMIATSDGKHTVITDDAYGLGFLTIQAYDGSLCADPFGEWSSASALSMSLSMALIMSTLY